MCTLLYFRRALVVSSITSNIPIIIMIIRTSTNSPSPPPHSSININLLEPPTILSGLSTRRSTGVVGSSVIIDNMLDTDR